MALTHLVALEAVFITARLLAQLAVPAQLVETLGLDAVGNLEMVSSTVQQSNVQHTCW